MSSGDVRQPIQNMGVLTKPRIDRPASPEAILRDAHLEQAARDRLSA